MDPLEMFERLDRQEAAWRRHRPRCERCREPIVQESAVFIGGEWYCDECLDECRRFPLEVTGDGW